MSESTDFNSHRLVFQEFVWEHHPSRLVIPFAAGLNILHGRTQAERTILLRLVRYALGGREERIDEKIMKASENVELRFLTNEEPVRVVRSCQHPSARLEVYDNLGQHSLSRSEMSDYLIDKLAFPKIYLPTTRADGTSGENPLSFGDLSRAFIIDRDISYSGIMAGAFDRTISETVKVMLGLTTREVAEAENRIRNFEARLVELKQSIVSIRKFLSTLDVPSLLEIEGHRQSLLARLVELQEEEAYLQLDTRKQIEAKPTNETSYDSLRTELLSKRGELNDKQRDVLNLTHQQREKGELRALLETEAERIERHISSHYVISTFLFSQCPRCLQPITKEMAEREASGTCMLCGRSFQEADDQTPGWEKALRDSRQSIHEIDTLIEDYQAREMSLRKDVVVLDARMQQLEAELARQASQYVAPIVERIRLISFEKVAIERELSQLDYQQRQRELAVRYEESDLPAAQSELEDVRSRLTEMRAKVGRASDHYSAFLSHFRTFLRSVDLDQMLESVDWDERTQLPLINGQSYKIMIGFDMAVTVMAFHYALLAMGAREPLVATGHPKLLIVDEPEQQKMGKQRYLQVVRQFARLGLENKDSVQVILATDTKDIPSDLEPYAFEM